MLECTGFFTTKEKASAHLKGGAKKVIISAPGGKDVDATIVYGVNHDVLKASRHGDLQRLVHDQLPRAAGQAAARQDRRRQRPDDDVHAYTNDQVLTDVYHEDLRRARSATMTMIPTKTGAAAAVGLVLPELNGKLDGFAIRVPTINVSLVDLSFIAARDTTVDEVNAIMKAASRTAPLKGILDYNTAAARLGRLQPRPGVVDLRRDADQGRRAAWSRCRRWYDNEWGFSNRMLDTTSR